MVPICFDSLQLKEDIELVEHVTLSVEIETDQILAQIACRLCEVTPDGLTWKADLPVQWNDEVIKETSATGHDK